jgi:hypothetical protein
MILYILYFTFKEKSIFDWGKLISIEISSQLSQYKKDKKLFMSSYLVFAIAYCCQFPKFSICKRVNCELDPVTLWYQALWSVATPVVMTTCDTKQEKYFVFFIFKEGR